MGRINAMSVDVEEYYHANVFQEATRACPSRTESRVVYLLEGRVAAVREAAAALESLGHSVELSYPPALEEQELVSQHFMTLITSWVATSLDAWGETIGRPIVAASVNTRVYTRASSRSPPSQAG
jgi:hypothetical protein